MRRADRLFQIIQLLRRGRLVTARRLAEKLEISERTVYRDVRDLVASGVPIEGEAGLGYVLRGFDLPPLMFTEEEITALALGARIVQSWADPALARAAGEAQNKIEAVLPKHLSRRLGAAPLFSPGVAQSPLVFERMAELRRALREQRKVRIQYRRADGATSDRVVRPLCLAFFAPIWLLAAYCELRQDFRNFRLDRMAALEFDGTFQDEAGFALEDFIRSVTAEVADRDDSPWTAPEGFVRRP